MNNDQTKKSTVGDPIWIESLLTRSEWKHMRKKFPSVFSTPEPPEMFEGDFKWRAGMGAFLKKEEIENINGNIDYLLTMIKK